ncbi:hypothetical protein EI94DRAFT_1809971 [Lactarius quietus]|nr:hypothetical protein EI94DRAFT_1809971 [Lactarius quietus]
MANHRHCARILAARLLCNPHSFPALPKPSVHIVLSDIVKGLAHKNTFNHRRQNLAVFLRHALYASVHAPEAHSTPVNLPHHQSYLLAPKIREHSLIRRIHRLGGVTEHWFAPQQCVGPVQFREISGRVLRQTGNIEGLSAADSARAAAHHRNRRVIVSRTERNMSNSNGDHHAQLYPPVLPVKFEVGATASSQSRLLGRKFYQMSGEAHKSLQSVNRAYCAAPFSGGQKVAYGTFDGLFPGFAGTGQSVWLKDVAHVDILDDYGLLIVSSEGQVITFPMDALEAMDPFAERSAPSTSLHSHHMIKIFEPIDQNVRGRNKPTFRKLPQGGNDTLQIYKEFYIPMQSSSTHFLRTRLCVACVNGFETIDRDTLDSGLT